MIDNRVINSKDRQMLTRKPKMTDMAIPAFLPGGMPLLRYLTALATYIPPRGSTINVCKQLDFMPDLKNYQSHDLTISRIA